MAATTTQYINSLYSSIIADHPTITFMHGKEFQWSAQARTIIHPRLVILDDIRQLLHEVSHALLDHQQYSRDIQLIDMEQQAWNYAITKLAPLYDVVLSEGDEIVQDTLDTYRQWLHERSTCPDCSAIGRQISHNTYECLTCTQRWTVNEARTCRLRRTKTNTRS